MRQLHILQGVTFTIEPGEMVAITGASGAGKSTLLHVLGALDLPTSGSLKHSGVELSTLSPSQLSAFRNKSLGFVFQFHHLLPEFTALENVIMPALIQRQSRLVADKRARQILERVGLGHRLSHRPSELSGGEQQRVALARAMALEPPLILADEPTGNLDTKTGAGVHELFHELNTERGVTMIIVTHNPELAESMPRQIKMIDGQIVDDRKQ